MSRKSEQVTLDQAAPKISNGEMIPCEELQINFLRLAAGTGPFSVDRAIRKKQGAQASITDFS